jgi:hypothetical protein
MTAAGVCRAAVQAIKRHSKGGHEYDEVLCILSQLLRYLSIHLRPAALAMLTAGDAVDLIVRHSAEEGLDVEGYGLNVMMLFMTDVAARKRMCARGVVEELLKGIAKWPLEVCVMSYSNAE